MSPLVKPKNRKRKKCHGFLNRSRCKGGRRVLKQRRRKGRKKISA